MDIAHRRKALFSGADFSSAIFYSGDEPGQGNASFRYFSGFEMDGAYLLLRKGGGTLFTHDMNIAMAKQQSPYPVKLLGRDGPAVLRKAAGRGKTGFVPQEMTSWRYLALKKRAKLDLAEIGAKVGEIRGRKSALEVAAIRRAAAKAREMLEELDPWECKTELELAARLKIKAIGVCAGVSFEPIVASGKNSRYPHHLPTNKRLEGHVLVDFGVKVGGYCSDFTRCYIKGGMKKEKEAYERCQSVHSELMDGLAGCGSGKDAALLAERLVEKNGLPKMIHAIGHGIGLEVHEYPHLGKASSDSLEGAVLAIEPAAYFSSFGVRFEEMAVNLAGKWKKI